jgi:phosphoribosylamine--glycine ligase
MNLLLLGSGGREHALAWKIRQSDKCDELYVSPGNPGTALCGKNISIAVTDFDAIKTFCVDNNIDLVVVGPEEPLVRGIVDEFASDPKVQHIPVIGPSKQAAQLEGSKAFAKKFMLRHGIPTANYREFDITNYQEGIPYLQEHPLPIVLKADGLAAGKGVIICHSHVEAMSEFELMLQQSKFGDAGKKVVVEEYLDGIEVSVFVLTDGENYILLPEAKDYKRVGEGDKGANTGGMGAVSPVPFADSVFMKKVKQRIVEPTIEGLKSDGIEYKGFIFIGVIKVNDEPFVIEYNCRLGDPETEVIIPRLKSDIIDLLEATAKKTLGKNNKVAIDPRSACTIVAVSGGYPGIFEKGFPIEGLDQELTADSVIFQAGTAEKDGALVTSGGRVLCVTSFGKSVLECVAKSRSVLKGIHFEDMYYRRDIGFEFTEDPN